MCLALAAAALLVTPVLAQDALPYGDAQRVPCKTLVASVGTALYGLQQDTIVSHFNSINEAQYFGSNCNIGDYVIKTCKQHPGFTVGRAIDDLISKRRHGQKLPVIGMCGA